MELSGYEIKEPNLDAVFAALADPTRRRILLRLTKGRATVGEIAKPFEISQPAISKHLKVLENAGLIARDADRQTRPARLNAAPMEEAIAWLEDFRAHWEKQLDQLDQLLAELQEKDIRMTSSTFVMTRNFAAPKSLVWRTWTEEDLVARWYGPGVETINHGFDPTEGGLWLVEMRMGEKSMFQRMEYTEVSPTERLVMLMSNADADWNVVPSPVMPNWPRVLLTTVELAHQGGGTELTLTWEPFEATEAEHAAFAAAVPDLDKGWGAGMDIIAEILAELQG